MRRLNTRILPVLLGLLYTCATAGAGEECILTTDGRLVRGVIRNVGAVLKVEVAAPRRDVYLSPVLVRERTPDPSAKMSPPAFVFHADQTNGKRAGTIAPVVTDFRWGAWDADGSATVNLRDPVLGAVEFRVVISRVTPEQTEMQGLEYNWVRSFPTETMEGLVLHLVDEQVRQDPTPEQWLKLAVFYRMRGHRERAEQALEEARKAGAAQDACDAERAALTVDSFERHLAELEEWLGTARAEDAFREAALLEIPAGLKAVDPFRYSQASERLKALNQRADRYREVQEALSKRNVPFVSLPPDQLDRLERVLRQGPARVDEQWIPDLGKEWAEGLALCKWDGQTYQEATRLAPLVETYFAQDDPKQAATLAGALKASQLPLEVKLSLLRHAARYPEAPAEAVNGWQRVEFRPPGAARTFHYFISVPTTYRPEVATPVLFTLHGQHSTAEVMYHLWSRHVAREGWILISPEYIYGREYGYLFSSEEHQAVVEAFRHAAGYLNIDADRVFLSGNSQGGHASWDMGAAHAGLFTAVVPIIGAPLTPQHWSNFKDTSVYAIDGSQDGPAPKMNQRGIEALARLRVQGTYVEYIDRGHEAFSEEYDTLCAWLRTRRRERSAEVNLVAFRNVERRRRWVDIQATQVPLADNLTNLIRPATVEGQIRPDNQIDLKTSNVTRLRILMPAGRVDLNKPVSVRINGRAAWRGTLQPDWGLALRECLTRRDRCDLFLAEVVLDIR